VCLDSYLAVHQETKRFLKFKINYRRIIVSGYRTAIPLGVIALITTGLFAQESQFRVRGEVTGGPSDLSVLNVELVDSYRRSQAERVPINRNGNFEFHGVTSGTYLLRIVTQDGTILRQEQVHINQFSGEIAVHLPDTPEAARPSSQPVSVARLRHKIPAKAKKAFAAAQKRSEAHDSEGSIQKLREAIALDPDYLEAHNNLGCRLLGLNRADAAVVSFQRAIELDAHAPYAHANLAAALLFLHRPEEAEAAARQALVTDGGISKTRYLLGLSLLQQHKFNREAAQSLRQAEDEFPNARLAHAAVLEHLGEVKEAKHELNTYLSSGVPEKRTEVKAWLLRLK
jgi:tetratricopeptide (TPR) repeat protein